MSNRTVEKFVNLILFNGPREKPEYFQDALEVGVNLLILMRVHGVE